MNMSRYKKTGWFGESHRHYLASKGVSTRRYRADVKAQAEWVQRQFDTSEGIQDSFEEDMERRIQSQDAKVVQKVEAAEEAGELDPINAPLVLERVREHQRRFRAKQTDGRQYQQDTMRELDVQLQQLGRKLKLDTMFTGGNNG